MRRYLFGGLALLAMTGWAAAPSKPKHAPPLILKRLEKKLSDFGITSRSFATWKVTGGKPSRIFYEVSFRRIEKPTAGSQERPVDPKVLQANGLALNGFHVQVADYLASSKDFTMLAMLRLNTLTPQVSKDDGQTWVDGEKVGDAWIFAFGNETLSLQNADETFTPAEFKAWGLEREALAKTEKGSTSTLAPYFHSVVIACAFGRNELQGLLKFPGAAFVVPIRGLRVKDRWLIRSTEPSPFNAHLWNHPGPTWWARGIREVGEDRQILQMELSKEQLLIGAGTFINYGVEGDSVDQLTTALEFDLTKGKALPDLADRYMANRTRNLWTRSDEEASFSRKADQAYISAGLKVWFHPSYQTSNSGFLMSGYPKKAEACQKPMVERLQRLGGQVNFIPLP